MKLEELKKNIRYNMTTSKKPKRKKLREHLFKTAFLTLLTLNICYQKHKNNLNAKRNIKLIKETW